MPSPHVHRVKWLLKWKSIWRVSFIVCLIVLWLVDFKLILLKENIFWTVFKAIKHIFERNCRISKVKRALRLVNMVECWRKRVRAHSRRKVSYIMLKNVAIMRLSVTLKTTAFCRKLSAKSSIIFDWTWLMYVWCLFDDCRQKQYRPGSETRYFTASITNLQEINDNWCSKALKMSYLL